MSEARFEHHDPRLVKPTLDLTRMKSTLSIKTRGHSNYKLGTQVFNFFYSIFLKSLEIILSKSHMARSKDRWISWGSFWDVQRNNQS